MNMNMIMNGQRGVKMTTISNALTTSQIANEVSPSSFLSLIHELVESMTANESDHGREIDLSDSYASFIKKLEEIDVTKIDATWLHSMIAVWPLVDNGSLEQTDALSVIQALTVSKQQDMSQNSMQIAAEVFDEVQEFLSSQGVSSMQANQVVEKLIQIEQSFILEDKVPNQELRLMSDQNLSAETGKPILIETTKQDTSEVIVAMNQMSTLKPAVIEVAQSELEILSKFSLKTEEGIEPQQEKFKLNDSSVVNNAVQFAMRTDNVMKPEANEMLLKNDVIDQVQSQVAVNLKAGNDEFVMKLNPEGLGEITVKMVMQESGKIIVNIQTQSQEVKAILSQEMNQLKSSLLPYNTEIGEITSYVNNDGYYQQSAYQHNSQQQSQFHRPAKFSYEYYQQGDLIQEEKSEVLIQAGKLLTYA